MIRFVLGVVAGLAAVVVVDFCRWCLLSEKDRFYLQESKRYDGLDVGIVELKEHEK